MNEDSALQTTNHTVNVCVKIAKICRWTAILQDADNDVFKWLELLRLQHSQNEIIHCSVFVKMSHGSVYVYVPNIISVNTRDENLALVVVNEQSTDHFYSASTTPTKTHTEQTYTSSSLS